MVGSGTSSQPCGRDRGTRVPSFRPPPVGCCGARCRHVRRRPSAFRIGEGTPSQGASRRVPGDGAAVLPRSDTVPRTWVRHRKEHRAAAGGSRRGGSFVASSVTTNRRHFRRGFTPTPRSNRSSASRCRRPAAATFRTGTGTRTRPSVERSGRRWLVPCRVNLETETVTFERERTHLTELGSQDGRAHIASPRTDAQTRHAWERQDGASMRSAGCGSRARPPFRQPHTGRSLDHTPDHSLDRRAISTGGRPAIDPAGARASVSVACISSTPAGLGPGRSPGARSPARSSGPTSHGRARASAICDRRPSRAGGRPPGAGGGRGARAPEPFDLGLQVGERRERLEELAAVAVGILLEPRQAILGKRERTPRPLRPAARRQRAVRGGARSPA